MAVERSSRDVERYGYEEGREHGYHQAYREMKRLLDGMEWHYPNTATRCMREWVEGRLNGTATD